MLLFTRKMVGDLSRLPRSTVCIGDDIKVFAIKVKGSNEVILGIEAPQNVPVHRGEIWEERAGNKIEFKAKRGV